MNRLHLFFIVNKQDLTILTLNSDYSPRENSLLIESMSLCEQFSDKLYEYVKSEVKSFENIESIILTSGPIGPTTLKIICPSLYFIAIFYGITLKTVSSFDLLCNRTAPCSAVCKLILDNGVVYFKNYTNGEMLSGSQAEFELSLADCSFSELYEYKISEVKLNSNLQYFLQSNKLTDVNWMDGEILDPILLQKAFN